MDDGEVAWLVARVRGITSGLGEVGGHFGQGDFDAAAKTFEYYLWENNYDGKSGDVGKRIEGLRFGENFNQEVGTLRRALTKRNGDLAEKARGFLYTHGMLVGQKIYDTQTRRPRADWKQVIAETPKTKVGAAA